MGNLRSVAKALAHVAPDAGRRRVRRRGDDPRARTASCCPARAPCPTACRASTRAASSTPCVEVLRDRPFLGICLGLQMLFDDSEEGPTRCLGAIPGRVVRFRDEAMVSPAGERLKVPHMGWSPVRQARPHPLWAGIEDGARFYFAHSYHPVPDGPGDHRRRRSTIRRRLLARSRGLISSRRNSIRKKVSAPDCSCSPTSSPGTGAPDASRHPRLPSPRSTAAPRRCHADHSRDRHQGRPLRPPQAGRHAVGDRVLRGPGRDGAALARAGRAAAAHRRPQRRRRRQAAQRARDPRDRERDRRGDPGAAGRRHPRPRHHRALPRRRHQLHRDRHRRGEESRASCTTPAPRSPATSSSASTRATARWRPTAGRR